MTNLKKWNASGAVLLLALGITSTATWAQQDPGPRSVQQRRAVRTRDSTVTSGIFQSGDFAIHGSRFGFWNDRERKRARAHVQR